MLSAKQLALHLWLHPYAFIYLQLNPHYIFGIKFVCFQLIRYYFKRPVWYEAFFPDDKCLMIADFYLAPSV